MGIIRQIINSFIFWGAWIIIPVIMEIIPAFGSVLLLLKRRIKHEKTRPDVEYYPEISLIIPVYNSADTLFACIQSVYHSNYPQDRIRIFLVNNQGQDESFDIFAKCQQRYPKLRMQWLNAEQGKSKALNLALYNSEGKYIINLDSDGILEPSALFNMVRKFENNPDLNCMTGAILTNPAKIKAHKRLRSRLLRNLEFMEYAQAFLAGRSYASELDAVYTLSGAFSAFRKSAILKSRLYNTDTICEDTQVTFQMRYIYKEKVEICEDAIFYVDPIDNMNKLYTQRQRWQRGSLEVAKMFMDEKFVISRAIKDVNIKTLLYDHTFAFPRLIWYLALICLMGMNYSSKVILYSILMLFALYIVVGFLYFGIVVFFLRKTPIVQKYYRNHWWCVFLLPFFNLMVFFIRMAGIINSIQTDSSWYTRNLTQEKKAFADVVREDVRKPFRVLRGLRRNVNKDHQEESRKTSKHGPGWYFVIGFTQILAITIWVVGDWVKRTLGVGLHEIVNTLGGNLEGAGSDMVNAVIMGCVVPVLCILAVLIVVLGMCYIFVKKRIFKPRAGFYRVVELASVMLLLSSVLFLNNRYELLDYVKAQNANTTIYEDYYVTPSEVAITANGETKNLIYIYVESLETTYASVEDGGKQGTNYMPKLTQFAKDYISFSDTETMGGWHNITGTNWTMAALLATTSGVPYAMPVTDTVLGEQADYMPGLKTLGDILYEKGYQQEFLCGSDANFSGRAKYFKQHGNYAIFDVYTAKEKGYIPHDYWEWWGFEDKVLYEIAKDEILRLAKEEQPFNFTMLTVDMHATEGYVCDICGDDYEVTTANVVACADKQIAEFVAWCQEQDFYEDTVIVITGDHPRMDSYLVEDVTYYDRTVYNCFINSEVISKQEIDERTFTAVDVFPTVLAALGFELEGDRLGLGVNLFSEEKTLAEKKGFEWLEQEISKASDYYVETFAPDLQVE